MSNKLLPLMLVFAGLVFGSASSAHAAPDTGDFSGRTFGVFKYNATGYSPATDAITPQATTEISGDFTPDGGPGVPPTLELTLDVKPFTALPASTPVGTYGGFLACPLMYVNGTYANGPTFVSSACQQITPGSNVPAFSYSHTFDLPANATSFSWIAQINIVRCINAACWNRTGGSFYPFAAGNFNNDGISPQVDWSLIPDPSTTSTIQIGWSDPLDVYAYCYIDGEPIVCSYNTPFPKLAAAGPHGMRMRFMQVATPGAWTTNVAFSEHTWTVTDVAPIATMSANVPMNSIRATEADVSGSIDSAQENSTFQFQVRKVGTSPWIDAPGGSGTTSTMYNPYPASRTITGLDPNSDYEIRLHAENSFGSHDSSIRTLLTGPAIVMSAATNTTSYGLTANATADPGSTGTVSYQWRYTAAPAPGVLGCGGGTATTMLSGPAPIAASASLPSPGNMYLIYRLEATKNGRRTCGPLDVVALPRTYEQIARVDLDAKFYWNFLGTGATMLDAGSDPLNLPLTRTAQTTIGSLIPTRNNATHSTLATGATSKSVSANAASNLSRPDESIALIARLGAENGSGDMFRQAGGTVRITNECATSTTCAIVARLCATPGCLTPTVLSSPATSTAGQVKSIVLTMNATVAELHINGVSVATASRSGTIPLYITGTTTIEIGKGSATPYTDALDDVAIYDKVLSAGNIADLNVV